MFADSHEGSRIESGGRGVRPVKAATALGALAKLLVALTEWVSRVDADEAHLAGQLRCAQLRWLVAIGGLR